TLVGKHRRQTFLVVGHQVYTHLRRDFGPLLFADPLQILKVAFSMGGNEGMRFKPNIPRYMATSIVTSMQWSRTVPLEEKQPQSIMFPPQCLPVGMVFIFSLLPPPNAASRVDAKELDFGLICPHPVSQSSLESFKCSLANFRRPCTCASLSRGTLRVLQYFKPLRRSVLPMVFFVTVVPAALRSFTSSPCVVLGLFCAFRMITDTARGDILHGAPDLERLTVVWCCFHLRIIAQIVVCFSPSCLPMVL